MIVAPGGIELTLMVNVIFASATRTGFAASTVGLTVRCDET